MNISQENASDIGMRKNRLYEQQLELCCQYDRQREENCRKLQKIQDEVRKHLGSVYELLRKDEIVRAEAYIRCLIWEMDLCREKDETGGGNIIADSLIEAAHDRAQKENIDFAASVQLSDRLPVRACDLAVVLRNLLDHALNNCQSADPETRRIDVEAESQRDILTLTVRYSCRNSEEKTERTEDAAEISRAGCETDWTVAEQAVRQYRGKVSVEQEENSCRIVAVMFGDGEAAE